MKRLLFAVAVVLTAFSCGDDCPQSDFTGDYLGDRVCTLGTGSTGETVTVSAGSVEDELSIAIGGENLSTEIKGCDLKVDDTVVLGNGFRGDASLAGDVLSVDYQVKLLTVDIFDCQFSGTKQ